VEFASAVARLVRTQEITRQLARTVFADFDMWRDRATNAAIAMLSDILVAAAFIRRLDLPLRTTVALNMAIGRRCLPDPIPHMAQRLPSVRSGLERDRLRLKSTSNDRALISRIIQMSQNTRIETLVNDFYVAVFYKCRPEFFSVHFSE
jgi:hypothetical protein